MWIPARAVRTVPIRAGERLLQLLLIRDLLGVIWQIELDIVLPRISATRADFAVSPNELVAAALAIPPA